MMTPEVIGGWDDTRQRKEAQTAVVLDDGIIRMREIWVGNLAGSVTETTLYNYFFIYGEIDKIDVFQYRSFAFVRFKLTGAAARAVEQANGLLIDGRPVRVAFADQSRRADAIGDKPGYLANEGNARTLFVQYNKPGLIQVDGKMQEVLNRYGRVKALYIKQMPPNSYLKPYLYVDYVTHVLFFAFTAATCRRRPRTRCSTFPTTIRAALEDRNWATGQSRFATPSSNSASLWPSPASTSALSVFLKFAHPSPPQLEA